MSTLLYPPLPLIERELFGEERHDDSPAADLLDPAWPAGAGGPEMPDDVLALVRRRSASVLALTPGPLAVGQVRGLPAVPQTDGNGRRLGRTCAVLLGRWIGGRRWAGWMVAQEADYATDRDLVLQDDDGVFVPEAAVVQTWNPVEVEMRGGEALLGRLSAAALGAVLKLSCHVVSDEAFVAPRPGRVGAWNLDQDTTVVTGTPIGADDDPRLRYQALYRRLGRELAAAAPAPRLAAAVEEGAVQGWLARLRHVFVKPAWTFGAMAVVLGQAAWMVAGPQYGPEREVLYRGATPALQDDACRTRIRVMFRLDTSYADLVLTLRRIDATLVSGPSETGEVWILPAPDQKPEEAAAMLRQSHLVERIDLAQPESRQCKR